MKTRLGGFPLETKNVSCARPSVFVPCEVSGWSRVGCGGLTCGSRGGLPRNAVTRRRFHRSCPRWEKSSLLPLLQHCYRAEQPTPRMIAEAQGNCNLQARRHEVTAARQNANVPPPIPLEDEKIKVLGPDLDVFCSVLCDRTTTARQTTMAMALHRLFAVLLVIPPPTYVPSSNAHQVDESYKVSCCASS